MITIKQIKQAIVDYEKALEEYGTLCWDNNSLYCNGLCFYFKNKYKYKTSRVYHEISKIMQEHGIYTGYIAMARELPPRIHFLKMLLNERQGV